MNQFNSNAPTTSKVTVTYEAGACNAALIDHTGRQAWVFADPSLSARAVESLRRRALRALAGC